ncbi:pyruvate, water dikinase [Haloechinothrix alba]|uniref:Phosphoenolpyruvate synthase n=1 Tax=Haloechinothrix alba TaxID=664784 RepID=A0A238X3S0_9PSEU|nr:PEP/pyruvate-binding domain-containing protein [Haloechinothrix alba]SNR53223.1 pyruvate, water dikinase [Haloechinothrix alba]
MKPVHWLDDMQPGEAVGLGGAKIGRLVEMMAAGVHVPRGFVVGVDAYRAHCQVTGLDERIDAALAPLPPDAGEDRVAAAADEIRAAFEATALDSELAGEIGKAYQELTDRCQQSDLPVAVRSSATGEDSSDASFAGIFETYLGVSGPDAVLESVRACWTSLFTPRALSYRLQRGISHHAMPMAVGVLELIQARASGVAFSVHPITGKRDRMVVEGSWGWGEAVVQGLVTPDHAEIGKSDARVLRYDTARKETISEFDNAAGRVTESAMPEELREARAVDDDQLHAITAAVRSIEEHYGHPVDVEWVIHQGHQPGDPACIVQSRPVTVAAQEPEDAPTGWNSAAFAGKYAFGGKK